MAEVEIKAYYGGLLADRQWIKIDFGNDQTLNIKVTDEQLKKLAYNIINVIRESATHKRKFSIELTRDFNKTLTDN